MANLLLYARFMASKVGKTGLSPTLDVDRIDRTDGTRVALLTGGATTEGRRGYYYYLITDVDVNQYDYVGVFVTSDTSVDSKEEIALRSDFSGVQSGDVFNRLGAPVGASISADIQTRSTYAGADTPGTGTLLGRLTSGRAASLDFLSGDAFARIGVAGAGLTVLGDARLAHLDANVSSVTGGGGGGIVTGFTADALDAIEDAVWDAATADHTDPATYGVQTVLATPGGGGGGGADPWAVLLPGAYPAGTAGFLLGTYVDVRVSSRSIYAGGPVASVAAPVTVGTNQDKTGYSLSPAERATLADAILDLVNGIEPGETPRQFLRKIRAVLVGTSTATGVFRRRDGATPSVSFILDGQGARAGVVEGSN